MIRKLSKKQLIIGIILLIIVLIGFTYALVTNIYKTYYIGSSPKIDIVYTGNNSIMYNSMIPISDEQIEEYAIKSEFTIKGVHGNPSNAYYDIALKDIAISDELKSSDFRWILRKNGAELSRGDFSNLGISGNYVLTPTIQKMKLNNETADEYVFYLYLHETEEVQAEFANVQIKMIIGFNLYTSNTGNSYNRPIYYGEAKSLFDYMNFDYTGTVQEFIAPITGEYKLEVWGAQGGTYSSYKGGKGGYSTGSISLTKGQKLYVYVGGQGPDYPGSAYANGGWNGGGGVYGYSYYSNTDGSGTSYKAGGGGGTDISIINSDITYANYRTVRSTESLLGRIIVAGGGGGSGSSLNGEIYSYGGGITGGANSVSYAGGQTAAGTDNSPSNVGAGFGFGGSNTISNYKYVSPGGGGGWYGGSGNYYSDSSSSYRLYSGGGSGYVYTDSTASSCPSGCLLNSSYYLTDASTSAGNQSIPNPRGTGNITGNTGNGYARITLNNYNIKEVEDLNATFDYTGTVQTFTAKKTGNYKIEVWGAQGGYYTSGNNTYGGKGGYAKGEINLEKGETLYVYVGQFGGSAGITAETGYTFNGGGARGTSWNGPYNNGGGATDVRLTGGAWDDTFGLRNRIIVAGGGGSAYNALVGINNAYGGGLIGGLAYNQSTGNSSQITGGTSNKEAGTFGFGGRKNPEGGGGGYYGGGSGAGSTGGGGGSGYISGHPGCIAIKSSTNQTPKTSIYSVISDSYHFSSKVFNKTILSNGKETMPDPRGNGVIVGNSGNGYAKITYVEPLPDGVTEFEYSGVVQTYSVPKDGNYKLEVWGAQGGTADVAYPGGTGGYSVGVKTLTAGTTLYIYVGGVGTAGLLSSYTGGFNGGGNTTNTSWTNSHGSGSGGGATHIATESGLLSTLSSKLSSILLIGGGGGGARYYNSCTSYGGGSGGGYLANPGNSGAGASQSAGGTNSITGSFGQGASVTNGCAGAGGGGLYGGGAGNSCCSNSGGGGSGYIGGVTSSNGITAAMYCYNCTISSAPATLTYTTTNVSVNPISNYVKNGNGYARITYLP